MGVHSMNTATSMMIDVLFVSSYTQSAKGC